MSDSFYLVKKTELPPFRERAANGLSPVILLRYVCPSFPLCLDKLLVLIRPVPEIPLLILNAGSLPDRGGF